MISLLGTAMKSFALALALTMIAASAYAADNISCKPEKKLSGAALTSSVTSCCNKQATAHKYAGAAKTSFVKKCIADGSAQ